jgi:nucleoside-diphosphate-sugar epimerase
MIQRALITGIPGFTGRYVAAALESAGYQVFGTCYGEHSAGETVFSVDLCDPVRLGEVVAAVEPQLVVHLAAVSFVAHDNVDAIYRTNVVGTRNLLAALAKHAPTVESILLASSANIYGNSTASPLTENTLPNPANDYAVSKLAMEYMAKLWEDKLPLFVVRPFNYTGVGQSTDFLLPKIVEHFKRRSTVIELGNLDVWRDFGDVRRVAQAYTKLLAAKPIGKTINICTGQTHSLREVLAMMEGMTGLHPEIRVNPAFVRQNEVRVLSGNNQLLKSLIGEWSGLPLEETLRWMLDWAEEPH